MRCGFIGSRFEGLPEGGQKLAGGDNHRITAKHLQLTKRVLKGRKKVAWRMKHPKRR